MILTKLRFENTTNKKTLKRAWRSHLDKQYSLVRITFGDPHSKVRFFFDFQSLIQDYLRSSLGIPSVILTKLRFENTTNKKTLKRAWRLLFDKKYSLVRITFDLP